MNNLLIIDCHCLGHIAKHAMKDLRYGDIETGIIFGFLRQLCDLMKKYPNYQPVFCWDSRKSIRRQKYTPYKIKRKSGKTEEDKYLDTTAHKQFGDLRAEILPAMGFKNNFIKTGYEADDIIASIVKEQSNIKNVVVANDEDLYQLLTNCDIYNPRQKVSITKNDFEKRYGLHPHKWIDVKCIAGCTSDNVAGIEGVGEITAIRYLKGELKNGSKVLEAIKQNDTLIKANRELVELPLQGVGAFTILYEDKYNKSAFIEICNYYGFRSFLAPESYQKWGTVLKFHA